MGIDAWAEGSYKITFGNKVSSTSSISSTKSKGVVIKTGTDFVTDTPFTVNFGSCYYGDTNDCIRVGQKSVGDASLSIALGNVGKVYATTIVVSAKNCGGACSSATLAVNGADAQPTTSDAAANYTYQINDNIESITLATSAGVFIFSITVNYTAKSSFPVTTVDDDFYSLYLDHAVSIPANTTVYKGSLDGNSLKLMEIEDIIPANTGVVFKTAEAASVDFRTCADEDPFKDNDIKGVAKDTPISSIETNGGKILVLGWVDGKVGFAQPEAGATTLAANKAYIIVPSTSGSKVRMVVSDDATAVEPVSVEQTAPTVYNISGQRILSSPVRGAGGSGVGWGFKGIVIVNGKKIINK